MGLSGALIDVLRHFDSPPVILCVGSDRLTGDCLGPIVGHQLIHSFNIETFVYGCLANPVTATNLEDTIGFVKAMHPRRKVLVIDASLGRNEDIGMIRLIKGGIAPGSASGKKLPLVGNLCITAVVNLAATPLLLQSTRLGSVFRLASIISSSVAYAVGIHKSLLLSPAV